MLVYDFKGTHAHVYELKGGRCVCLIQMQTLRPSKPEVNEIYSFRRTIQKGRTQENPRQQAPNYRVLFSKPMLEPTDFSAETVAQNEHDYKHAC